MRKMLIPCAIVAILCSFVSISAADEGRAVNDSTLSSMGLGGMQSMSDADGLSVRGKGTSAAVWGGSQANWSGGQSSTNNYQAASNWVHKSAFAKGGSVSFAGKIQANYVADPTGSALSVTICGGIAGGGAFAIAK